MSKPERDKLTEHSPSGVVRDVRPKKPQHSQPGDNTTIHTQQEGLQTSAPRETPVQPPCIEENDTTEWQRAETIVCRQTDDIIRLIDVMQFMGNIVKKDTSYGELHDTVEGTRTHIQKLKVLLQHIFEHKDSFLLSHLVSNEDLEDLNLADSVGGLSIVHDLECINLDPTSRKKLEDCLDHTEVDLIADHLYQGRHITYMTWEDIIHEKRRTKKIRLLLSNINNKDAYSHLLDILTNKINRVDISSTLPKSDADDSSGLELSEQGTFQAGLVTAVSGGTESVQISRAHTVDFIARYVMRECLTKLLPDLQPSQVNHFVDKLYETEVLDREMREDIYREEIQRCKARCLLDKLLYVGSKGYRQFKHLLNSDESSVHLVYIMEVVEQKLREKSDTEIEQMMREEVAELRCYLEWFDGVQWKKWNLKDKGSREKIKQMLAEYLQPYGLTITDVYEACLALALACDSVESLLKFYKAYKSGELAEAFTNKAHKVKIVIDKHTLISAFVILVNRDWPRESRAVLDERLAAQKFLGGDMSQDQQADIASVLAAKERIEVGQSLLTEKDLQYDMSHKYRGLLVLINNTAFSPATRRGPRVGSDIDADNLQNTFRKLGFDVRRQNNLTCRQMDCMMREVEEFYHGENDCFACAVLTHGAEGEMVFGTDGMMKLDTLIRHVRGSKCPTLVGKPKMFFIQACRGNKSDKGVMVSDGSSPVRIIQKIPTEADLLVVNSTAPGYISWTTDRGSMFVETLCDILNKYGSTRDVIDLLTMVNRVVAYDFHSRSGDPEMAGLKQIPSITSQLTKKVYFNMKKR